MFHNEIVSSIYKESLNTIFSFLRTLFHTDIVSSILGSRQVWMSPLPQVAVQATQIGTGPERHQHGPCSLLSTWPSMVTEPENTSIDPGYSRTTDQIWPSAAAQDVTMTEEQTDLDAS